MQPTSTATQRLASNILGSDVAEWIMERRRHPYMPSWATIAEELKQATNGQVDVSRETIRLWYQTFDQVAS